MATIKGFPDAEVAMGHSGTSSPDGWTDVDEDPHDGDTTRRWQDLGGNTLTYAVDEFTHDLEAGDYGGTPTISNVTVVAMAKSTGTGYVPSSVKVGLKVGGTAYYGTPVSPGSSDYEPVTASFDLNPDTSAAWTAATVAAANLLCAMYGEYTPVEEGGESFLNVYYTQLYLEATFTLAAATFVARVHIL